MKTPEQIAREVAETATLSDTESPTSGAFEPIIEDFDQLAAFIEDGIRADRAQRTPATSSSDRHEAALTALRAFRERSATLGSDVETEQERALADSLAGLIEPAPVTSSANDDAMCIWGSRASVDLTIATRGHHPEVISLMEQVWHAGLNAGWVDWEPENAPGMVDTRATDVIDIVFDRLPDNEGANFIEVEDAHGASISLGEWVSRPDGHAALRVEVVR